MIHKKKINTKIQNSLFRFALIFLLCILMFQTNAQKAWTLEDCINYALKNNINIKQRELGVMVAKADLTQSKMNLLPNLNGSASHAYNYGQTIDMYTNQFATEQVLSENFYINSNLILFNGFQSLNAVRQNQLEYLASKYDADKMRNDISLSIATAYLQILFNMELLDIAKGQLDMTQQQIRRTQILVDAQTLTKGSLYDIQAQGAMEELQVVNAQNQLDIAYLNLAQLIDISTTDSITVLKPSEITMPSAPSIVNPDQIFSTALTSQPEIKSAEYKLQAAEKGLFRAMGAQSPSISLRGSYGTGYSGASKVPDLNNYSISNDTMGYIPVGVQQFPLIFPTKNYEYHVKPFNDQINDNVNKSIGFYLNVPIFNGYQVRTAVSKAKLNVLNYQYTLELTQNQLKKNIEQAFADAVASNKKYLATNKTLVALQESFNYAEQKFNLGVINSTDYNLSKNKLMKAKSDILQAKYDFIFKTKVLDFYQGKPITLK